MNSCALWVAVTTPSSTWNQEALWAAQGYLVSRSITRKEGMLLYQQLCLEKQKQVYPAAIYLFCHDCFKDFGKKIYKMRSSNRKGKKKNTHLLSFTIFAHIKKTWGTESAEPRSLTRQSSTLTMNSSECWETQTYEWPCNSKQKFILDLKSYLGMFSLRVHDATMTCVKHIYVIKPPGIHTQWQKETGAFGCLLASNLTISKRRNTRSKRHHGSNAHPAVQQRAVTWVPRMRTLRPAALPPGSAQRSAQAQSPSLSRPQPEPARAALKCAHAQREPFPDARTERAERPCACALPQRRVRSACPCGAARAGAVRVRGRGGSARESEPARPPSPTAGPPAPGRLPPARPLRGASRARPPAESLGSGTRPPPGPAYRAARGRSGGLGAPDSAGFGWVGPGVTQWNQRLRSLILIMIVTSAQTAANGSVRSAPAGTVLAPAPRSGGAPPPSDPPRPAPAGIPPRAAAVGAASGRWRGGECRMVAEQHWPHFAAFYCWAGGEVCPVKSRR